jgi:DNA-binding XRE family transcriptional regulator
MAMRQPARGEEPPEPADPLLSEVRQLREVYEAILDALRAADRRFASVEQQIAPSTGLVTNGVAARQTRTRGGWTTPGEWELSTGGAVTGESLRQRREALGVSQAAIAHAAHCSRGLVAEVERGRRRSALTLSHLSQVLDHLERDARRR